MLVLGLSGGPEPVYNHRFFRAASQHDAAAVLVRDGKVIAAVEEERLTRIKHTNKAPTNAARFCLASQRLALRDLNLVMMYGDEAHYDAAWRLQAITDPDGRLTGSMRQHLHRRFQEDLDDDIDDAKLRFVPHHIAHAVSAFVPSGFDRSLVVTIDGVGDGIAGMVLDAAPGAMNVLATIPAEQSLGMFYLRMSQFLGFDRFEEYKVMGLAPYGDPARFASLFAGFYRLDGGGKYELLWDRMQTLQEVAAPRKRRDPIERVHQDIAASMQAMLVAVTFHLLGHYRRETGHSTLCLAGGVAQNCSLNGAILRADLFDQVFVQPAAHDAGCALGAALHPFVQDEGARGRARLADLYWGPHIGAEHEIGETLERWGSFVTFERVADVAQAGAERLAAGAILGWAHGRSEFGPRALGHRSILADARPAGNKELINAIVKKREAFRPFAPAVLQEVAHEFFELPANHCSFPYMIFTALVKPERRALLAAVTHVDGTARLQTVSRDSDPLFWNLIAAFGALTGTPVVLNTSFNNDCEPIVDSAEDAIVCALTTGLDELFIGDFHVKKRPFAADAIARLAPSLPAHMQLVKTTKWVSRTTREEQCELRPNDPSRPPHGLSPRAYNVLARANGQFTIAELAVCLDERDEDVAAELFACWSKRAIWLAPPAAVFKLGTGLERPAQGAAIGQSLGHGTHA